MSDCLTLHFITLQGSRDQSNAQDFIKYIRQQSPAPLLESALVRRCCDSHCYSWTGWSRIFSPMISAVHPNDISWMISAVASVIGPEIFARKAAGSIVWTAAEDFCLVCVSVLAGLGLASASSRDSVLANPARFGVATTADCSLIGFLGSFWEEQSSKDIGSPHCLPEERPVFCPKSTFDKYASRLWWLNSRPSWLGCEAAAIDRAWSRVLRCCWDTQHVEEHT